MDKLYEQFIANKQKAIVAFILGVVGSYIAKYGFDIQTLTVGQLIERLIYGAIAYVGVYLKANK